MTQEDQASWKPVAEMGYSECAAQLEQILQAMQRDCDIDRLAAYTARAAELIQTCRGRLTTTQEEVNKILEKL